MVAKPAVKQTSVFMQFCLLLKAEILRRKPYFSVVMFACFEKCCQISTVFNTQGGPYIKFGGKIWGKVRPSSPNKRKNLGSSVTKRRKSREKAPILESYLKFRGQNLGYLSFIFFRGKIWGSNKNFRGKVWGQAPRPPNMKVPPVG